jgi:hypothetical protein
LQIASSPQTVLALYDAVRKGQVRHDRFLKELNALSREDLISVLKAIEALQRGERTQ